MYGIDMSYKENREKAREVYMTGYTVIEHPEADCVVGTQDDGGKLLGIAFAGTSGKPAWNYRFRTVEQRTKYINDFVEQQRERIESKQNRKAEQQAATTAELGVKVGDIYYASWGYDQTNLNFFQIVALVGKYSVKVREVNLMVKETEHHSDMARDVSFNLAPAILPQRSNSTFLSGNPDGDIKRVGIVNGEPYINLCSYASAYPYKGEKLYESWYA